jgi:SAM-dependent methyltransferase
MFSEINVSCQGLDEWESLAGTCAFLKDLRYIRELVNNIRLTGFVDPIHGWVGPNDFALADDNYREGFSAHGLNSRCRAILTHVVDYILAYGSCSTVYLADGVSPFADMMSNRFAYLIKSEYISDPVKRWKLSHIRHEDPVALSLPAHAFDLYVSPDTMVYAVNMDAFLREARRVLRRSGVLLATFPFRYGEQESRVQAEMVDGEIVHHGEPQYHDDPLDSERKRLAYFTPGWDILDAARSAGFQSAEIVVHSSRTNAILGAEIAAVFVLKATA